MKDYLPIDTTIPDRINVRLKSADRAAVTDIISALTTPHRRSVSLSEAILAAISIAHQSLQTETGAA